MLGPRVLSKYVALPALLWFCAAPGHAQPDPSSAPAAGPVTAADRSISVRLALTSVVVAPGKESGLPWDGFGRLPAAAEQAARSPLPPDASEGLFRWVSAEGVLQLLGDVLPWAAGSFVPGFAAPDVEATLYVDGRVLAQAPTVANRYTPAWANVYTPPIKLHPYSQIEIRAVDRDLLGADPIGVCTLQGIPLVDARGYALAQNFQCFGQLWAVALRLVPVEPAEAPRAVASPSAGTAPTRAAPLSEPKADRVYSGAPAVPAPRGAPAPEPASSYYVPPPPYVEPAAAKPFPP